MRNALVTVSLLVVLCLSHALTLGQEEDEKGEKREAGRRTTRDRYRMGYMFGKRSGVLQDGAAAILLQSLTGAAVTVDELTSAMQEDPQLARQVARHLDRNGDGLVTASELL